MIVIPWVDPLVEALTSTTRKPTGQVPNQAKPRIATRYKHGWHVTTLSSLEIGSPQVAVQGSEATFHPHKAPTPSPHLTLPKPSMMNTTSTCGEKMAAFVATANLAWTIFPSMMTRWRSRTHIWNGLARLGTTLTLQTHLVDPLYPLWDPLAPVMME